MTQRIRRCGIAFFAMLAIAGTMAQTPVSAQERFEITSIKAIRPTLVNTIAALQQHDALRAQTAFEAFDSGWNGIEFYINTRSKEAYDTLEHGFQPKITKALEGPSPDFAAVLADAQAMLVKFDDTVSMIAKLPPLNGLYDDVARLRIVRAHLREVPPALKAANFAKARKSFEEFDNHWDSIEDLIKNRSADAYVAIEKGMIEIEKALMPDKPDAAQATALVNTVMSLYNAVLAEIAKEARSRT